MIEATITTSWSVRCVPVEYLLTMIASVSGAVSDTTARTASRVRDRRALDLGGAFGERAYGGVQRRGAEQEVEGRPTALQIARLVVVRRRAARAHPYIASVTKSAMTAGEQEVERRVLLAAADGEPDRAGDEHQVHQRVADGHELLHGREGRVVRVRRDQEDPRQHADADADDQRVDGAVAVAARAAMTDQQQDAEEQTRVDRQVEDVADRRVRQLRAEEPIVVVRDDVAGHEERLGPARSATTAACTRRG